VFDPDRRHLLAYIAAAAVLVVIAVRFIGHQSGQSPAPSISMAAPAAPVAGGRVRPRAAPSPSIWVDVAGAVRRPGLYRLPAGSRVAAALGRAGGVTRRAERSAVNLAAKLGDGQQVLVPARMPGAPVAVAAAATAAASAPGSASAPGAPVSLSAATQVQLEQLDGIGPALAGRILEYRQAHGGFRSVDELQEVSGIGQKRFQALRATVRP
jgi:competence protein ComEA